MSADEAINGLDTLRGDIRRFHHAFEMECDGVQEQWSQLQAMGGARADHAAMLLSRLRQILDDMAAYETRCSQQITGMVADPFGRKAA